jgi:hypothetical protein
MKVPDDQPCRALGCESLAEYLNSCVVCVAKIATEYHELDDRQQARLKRAMERWCEGSALTNEMFNPSEGRSVGNLMLKVFKTHKIRLYGYETIVDNKKVFIIVERDLSKKKDKADQALLKRARKYIDAMQVAVGNLEIRSGK